MNKPSPVRPPLATALTVWREHLAAAQLPTDLLWVFPENLCIETATTAPDGLRVGFQTKFTPPDEDALEVAYDIFSETAARIVFYRLGTAGKVSVCILLCDPWLEKRGESEGFIRHDEWNISFRPGGVDAIEEVTELARWVRRVKRNRAFHDYDFGLALATIDEIKLHGRPLLPFERMADKLATKLRRKLGQD